MSALFAGGDYRLGDLYSAQGGGFAVGCGGDQVVDESSSGVEQSGDVGGDHLVALGGVGGFEGGGEHDARVRDDEVDGAEFGSDGSRGVEYGLLEGDVGRDG